MNHEIDSIAGTDRSFATHTGSILSIPHSILTQLSEYVEQRSEKPFHHFRLVILVVSLITMTLAMANPLVLNFTIICMVEERDYNSSDDNDTDVYLNPIDIPQTEYRGMFHWSVSKQSTALSSFSWGAILAILPISYFSTKYGVRKVFASSVMISSLATIAIPPASMASYKLFIFLRMIQGIGYGAAMPLLGSVAARWAPIPEIGRFTGFGAMCFQLSPVVSMPLGGAACTSAYGWPLAYYVVGSLSAAFTILWFILYRETPAIHPWVTKKELIEIYRNKTGSGRSSGAKKPPVPFKSMLTSLPVWAILVATIGNMFSMYIVIYFIPTYLRTMMKLDLQTIGIISAVPTFCQAGVKLSAGVISDKLPLPGRFKGNETFKVKLFNSVAFIGAAIFYLICTAVNSDSQSAFAITMFALGVGMLGFSVGAFFKSATLVGLRYAPFIMGMVQMTTCITVLVIPYIVKPMIKHELFEEWNHVLIMAALVLVATNIFFVFFASGQAAKWTSPLHKDSWPDWCHRRPIESDLVSPTVEDANKPVWNSGEKFILERMTNEHFPQLDMSPNSKHNGLNGHIRNGPNGHIPTVPNGHIYVGPNGHIPIDYTPSAPNGHLPMNGTGNVNGQLAHRHHSNVSASISTASNIESDL